MNGMASIKDCFSGFWPLFCLIFIALIVLFEGSRYYFESRYAFTHPGAPGALSADLGLAVGAGFLGMILQRYKIRDAWWEQWWWLLFLLIVGFVVCGATLYIRIQAGELPSWNSLPVPEYIHWLAFSLTFATYTFVGLPALIVRRPSGAFWATVTLILTWLAGNIFDMLILPRIKQ